MTRRDVLRVRTAARRGGRGRGLRRPAEFLYRPQRYGCTFSVQLCLHCLLEEYCRPSLSIVTHFGFLPLVTTGGYAREVMVNRRGSSHISVNACAASFNFAEEDLPKEITST